MAKARATVITGALAALSCAPLAADTNRVTVTTLSGREYADASVLRTTADSVTLMLPDGIVRLAVTSLTAQARATLGIAPPEAQRQTVSPAPASPADLEATGEVAARIASLIDPAKLATLTGTGANPRMQKAVYWLEAARLEGLDPGAVATGAVAAAGMSGLAAELTAASLARSHRIASQLGCLDEEGLAEMRKGNAPTVRRGPYAGDQLSVDHIVPRSACPELATVIANLELMPMRMNREKSDCVGERQVNAAKKLHEAGLLGNDGLERVLGAK